MRCRAALALIMLALSTAPVCAQCFTVTVSAERVLRAKLSSAERAAVAREGQRRGCSLKAVPDGTEGAISAEQVRALVPAIRDELRGISGAGKVAKSKKKKAAAKRSKSHAVAQPRPRPPSAPLPAAAALEPPQVEATAGGPPPGPVALPVPDPSPALTKRERLRAWLRDVLRRIW